MYGMSSWFESLDQVRQCIGKSLDILQIGACESRYKYVLSKPGMKLRCYGREQDDGAALLIVPAPIKGPYIWDISPERSVIRLALSKGFRVYLVEWTGSDGHGLGLEEFAGKLLNECIEAIVEQAPDKQVFLAGHSLGGTLAALYTAYRPEQVAGLVLIEAPLRFAGASGDFAKLLHLDLAADDLHNSSGRVPGSLLNAIAAAASPETFITERHIDHFSSLTSPEKLVTHWRVVRWTLDELPMPSKLFDDIVERLYRRDDFMRGRLVFGDTQVRPDSVESPLAAVYDPRSAIIPPESVESFYRATASTSKLLIPYHGDTGVALQHVGTLIGDNAHRHIWPKIFGWLNELHLNQSMRS